MTMTGTQSPDRDDPGTRNGAVTTRLDPGLKAILAGITVEPVGDVGPARWSGAG
jgi:hypothetical protein